MSPYSLRFIIAFGMMVLILFGGTIGFYLIENAELETPPWTLSDSFYMTVITITTVGYTEVHPLSEHGRLFTVGLLLASMLTAGYSITTIFSFIFEGQILTLMRGRRMEYQIKKLENHFIICGGGEVGVQVAIEFNRARVPFVIIERNIPASQISNQKGFLYVHGDAENDETLLDAGIDRARGLVAALRQDETNVFVVLTARQLNPKLMIVARAAEERTIPKLKRAGADRVISPYRIAGQRIASVILRPSVMSFLDVMMETSDISMHLEEVPISPNSPMVGKALRDPEIGKKIGATVIGIYGANGRLHTNETESKVISSVEFQAGDVMIVLGNEEQIKTLRKLASTSSSPNP